MRRLVVVTVLFPLALVVPPWAHADTFSVNCAGLATELATAEDGDVFNMNVDECSDVHYVIPDGVDVTINGQAPDGTAFDNLNNDIFRVVGAAGAVTLRNVLLTN